MSQETALVVAWLKKEGDKVEKGDALLTVETDKVTVDIECVNSGILAGIKVKPGDTVPVTNVIAYLLADGESLPTGSAQAPAVATVAEKKPAADVQNAPVVATPVANRYAEAAGVDLSMLTGSGPHGKIVKADVVEALAKGVELVSDKVRATPAARRVSNERNLDLQDIPGSGPHGRIQVDDVVNYAPAAKVQTQFVNDEEIVPLAGTRKTIATRMQSSYQTAPHIMFTTRVDMSNFEALRAKLNQFADREKAPHISVTAMLVKITSWALLQHPWVNSSLRGEEVHLFAHVNMGIAVALPGSLIVPVVRGADQKSLSQITVEAKQLVERAQQSKLTPSDVTEGTFTISNLGPYGIEQFTAILNPGQAGILAIGATQPEAVVADNEIVIRPIMRFTLSVDHRVVDGALAAQFSATLREALENPGLIIW